MLRALLAQCVRARSEPWHRVEWQGAAEGSVIQSSGVRMKRTGTVARPALAGMPTTIASCVVAASAWLLETLET